MDTTWHCIVGGAGAAGLSAALSLAMIVGGLTAEAHDLAAAGAA